MMLRASECYAKKRAWHSAAKTLEQAMAIDQKRVREEGREEGRLKKWAQLFCPAAKISIKVIWPIWFLTTEGNFHENTYYDIVFQQSMMHALPSPQTSCPNSLVNLRIVVVTVGYTFPVIYYGW